MLCPTFYIYGYYDQLKYYIYKCKINVGNIDVICAFKHYKILQNVGRNIYRI